MAAKGTFLVLEGPNKAGKTTLTARLVADCKQHNRVFQLTREPGGTPTGEAMRAILKDPNLPMTPFCQALGFAAIRIEHLQSRILPARARGEVVICDRYSPSTWVYQLPKLSVTERATILAIHHLHCPSPDLTIFLIPSLGELVRRKRGTELELDRWEEDNVPAIALEIERYHEVAAAHSGAKLILNEHTVAQLAQFPEYTGLFA